jgi:hypothetical protein
VTRSLAALLIAILLGGCASAPPTGPIERPDIYPDRTSADAAWRTYLWAWKTGDIDVLLQVTGFKLHSDLKKELEVNGRERTAQHYRGGMDDVVIREARWMHQGDALAYVRMVLAGSAVGRAEVDFSLVGRGNMRPSEDWVVTERKKVR